MAENDGSVLAREWREARQAALELVAKLPETRAYRATDRAGWTLKHELSHLASLDAEIAHILASARQGVAQHLGPAVRRQRGEAMHRAQEMRLGALKEHLESAGEATADAIEDAAEALGHSLHVAEAEVRSVAELIRERVERAKESVGLFRQHLS
jgi:uncharacterized damage-inducible protein DinB